MGEFKKNKKFFQFIKINWPLLSQFQSLKGDTSDDQTTYVAAKSFHASKANKGQKSADFKGRLETFKAGYKAARDQYHEAKAQFKATTKALIHAKFNKGPKAKGNFLSSYILRKHFKKWPLAHVLLL